jgi:hypothetical protein
MWIIFKFGYILIVLIQILCVQSYNNHKEEIKCLPIGNYNQTQYVKGFTEKYHILTNESSSEATIIEYNVKNNLKLEFKIKCGKNGIWKKGEPEGISDKNNSISDDICYKNSKKHYYCFYEKILVHCEEKQSNVTQFNDNHNDKHKRKHNHIALYVMVGIMITLTLVMLCIIWFRFKNREPVALPAVVYNNFPNEINYNNSSNYDSIDYRYVSSHFVNEENLGVSNVSQFDQIRNNSIYESNENSQIKSYQ